MDNLTHSLVGLVAAKTGLEKLSPATTSVCLVAANAPDADFLVVLTGDRWDLLQHHRGITHAIVGTLVLGVLIPLIFYGADFLWSRLRHQKTRVQLRGLLLASLIVSATHPILDWTNNYGIRFLLPWNSRWFYGDLVFIVDPLMWLFLGGAAFLLTSKTRFQRLVWLTIGTLTTVLVIAGPRRAAISHPSLLSFIWIGAVVSLLTLFFFKVGIRRGRTVATVSFVLVLLYWSGLAYMHSTAIRKGNQLAAEISAAHGERVLRLAAMPTLANPLRWDCVFETDHATYRLRINLNSTSAASNTVRYEKPTGVYAKSMQAAASDRRAQVFLGFARFPVMKLTGEDCTTETFVQLADLRYTEPGESRGNFALTVPIDCPNATRADR